MKLQIIHTNDMHNHFPESTISRLRKPDALLLDSGDALQGSNTLFHFKEPILQSMRKLGYHAMAMGNREFHYIRKILRSRQEEASFPIISGNVIDLREKIEIKDRMIIPRNGITIGLFGLTVPQFPPHSRWEKITGWRFLPFVETAERISKQLRGEGADIVLCLSHLGFAEDQKLAENAKGIDIIFGGHSHTVLKEIVWINGTAIVQGGSHARFVGDFELTVSKSEEGIPSWGFQGELVAHHAPS